jgi:hypothetical protein
MQYAEPEKPHKKMVFFPAGFDEKKQSLFGKAL